MFFSVFDVIIVAEDDAEPDLTIDGIVVYGDTVEGEDITFVVTVANQRDVDINKNIGVALYIDYNWAIPFTANIPEGLLGNEEDSVNLTWTADVGTHTFTVFVDYQMRSRFRHYCRKILFPGNNYKNRQNFLSLYNEILLSFEHPFLPFEKW